MSTPPKVSVVIPTYNYGHFLDETIRSVLDQTFTDYELVIVDNGSTDNTGSVVETYLADNRVSFHKNDENLGLVGNWNKCLQLAQGRYIKFLCADDKFESQLLEKFVAVLDRYPDVALVSSFVQIFGSASRIRKAPFEGHINRQAARENLIDAVSWLYSPTAVMFRKTAVAKIGTFNTQLYRTTDKEYYLRLLTTGDCYVIPEVLSCIRAHTGSQSAKLRGQDHKNILEAYRFIKFVKNASTPETDLTAFGINARLKQRATICAIAMYKLLPHLHKKESRKLFRQAYQIVKKEGVWLAPLSHYFRKLRRLRA